MKRDPKKPTSLGNPWLRLDLRRRLRSNTGPTLLSGWALTLAAVTTIVVLNLVGTDTPTAVSGVPAPTLGRAVGQWWIITCTIGLAVLGVLSAAPSLAGAREQHTLNGWRTTLVRPHQIARGSALGTAAFVTLAAMVAAPVGVLAWRLGGIRPAALAVGLGGAWVTGICAGCISIAVSAIARRAVVAVVASLCLAALPFVATTAVQVVSNDDGPSAGRSVPMSFNPLVLVAEASTNYDERPRRAASTADEPLARLANLISEPDDDQGSPPAWLLALAGAAGLSLLSLVAATWRLRR